MSWSPVTDQVLVPGRNNPGPERPDSLGRSSAGKDLGDLVATKLTMSQHCTLVAKPQQEPRCQQAAAFSMGAVSRNINGNIPPLALSAQHLCTPRHPTPWNTHSSACHASWQVNLSLHSWTVHKALWPAPGVLNPVHSSHQSDTVLCLGQVFAQKQYAFPPHFSL